MSKERTVRVKLGSRQAGYRDFTFEGEERVSRIASPPPHDNYRETLYRTDIGGKEYLYRVLFHGSDIVRGDFAFLDPGKTLEDFTMTLQEVRRKYDKLTGGLNFP